MNARRVVCLLVSLVVGCGDVSAPISSDVRAPTSPSITIASDPPSGPEPSECMCEPLTCAGAPLVSGGSDGCSPVIGGYDLGSVEMQMTSGDTFSVWQGDDAPSLYMERQVNDGWARATFIDEVVAGSYATRSAPLLYGPTIQILPSHSTVRVSPVDGTAIISLPRAVEVPGRRFTIKIVGDGAKVVIQPAFDAAIGLWDEIDGEPVLTVDGGVHVVTLEAYEDSDGAGPDRAGWIVISP